MMKIKYRQLGFGISCSYYQDGHEVIPDKVYITIPHHEDDEGYYQLRVWDGELFTNHIYRGHVDSGLAESRLLLDIDGRTRADLVELANLLSDSNRPEKTMRVNSWNGWEEVDIWVWNRQ